MGPIKQNTSVDLKDCKLLSMVRPSPSLPLTRLFRFFLLDLTKYAKRIQQQHSTHNRLFFNTKRVKFKLKK